MALIEAVSGRLCGVNRPCQGERVSGDGLFYHEDDNGIILSVYDGLGHGDQAHGVSTEISAFLDYHHHQDIGLFLKGQDTQKVDGMLDLMDILWDNLQMQLK